MSGSQWPGGEQGRHDERLTRPVIYEAAVRTWFTTFWCEPHGLIAGSLCFILTALPIVTIGPAWLALAQYMKNRVDGVKFTWRDSCSFAFRDAGYRGWLLGLFYLIAMVLAGGSFLAVTETDMPLMMRYMYALLLIGDIWFMLAGLYSYSALMNEPHAKLSAVLIRGVLMVAAYPGWTLLFHCVILLTLIVCGLTVFGMVVLFPAAVAMMAVVAYRAATLMLGQSTKATDD